MLANPADGLVMSGATTVLRFLDGGLSVVVTSNGLENTRLFAVPPDQLWFTESSNYLRVRGTTMTSVSAPTGGVGGLLAHSADGGLWAANSSGVYRFNLGGWTSVAVPADCALSQVSFAALGANQALLGCEGLSFSGPHAVWLVGPATPLPVTSFAEGSLVQLLAQSPDLIVSSVRSPLSGSLEVSWLQLDGGASPLPLAVANADPSMSSDGVLMQTEPYAVNTFSSIDGWSQSVTTTHPIECADLSGASMLGSTSQELVWKDPAGTERVIASSRLQPSDLYLGATGALARGGAAIYLVVGNGAYRLDGNVPTRLGASVGHARLTASAADTELYGIANGALRALPLDGGSVRLLLSVSGRFTDLARSPGGPTWAVGLNDEGNGPFGVVSQSDGGWAPLDAGAGSPNWVGVASVDAGAWALSTARLWHVDTQGAFSPLSSPDAGAGGYGALCVADPNDAYVAASNGLWHFDGATWTRETNTTIYSLRCAAGGKAMAFNGLTMSRRNPATATWNSEVMPFSIADGVFAADGTAWVLGASGLLMLHP